jgi:hypothetical protein
MLPEVETKYTLGRNPDNTIIINKPQVSGHHATLTVISENIMLLEDHNSTNGTFVNGLQVLRILVGSTDKVMFGNLPINLDKLFAKNKPQVAPAKAPPQNNDYSAEFLILKDVYTANQEARKVIQNGDKLKVLARAGLVFVPYIGLPLGILMMGMLSSNEKYAVLDREYQLKYVCPKCRRYLGSVYWETLANQKRCGCGAVWIKE